MQVGAIVLLSGGLDSATLLALAYREEKNILALSFSYGQRHSIELERATALAASYEGCRHMLLSLSPQLFKGTALIAENKIELPIHSAKKGEGGIPLSYVPARNILFLSHALALAESYGASDIFIGVNAVDYSGYPDCRPEFIESFAKAARLGMRSGLEGEGIAIRAPLLYLSKKEIIQKGKELSVDYSLTSSCYQPDSEGRPCQKCDSCFLRARGFEEAGIPDPLLVAC